MVTLRPLSISSSWKSVWAGSRHCVTMCSPICTLTTYLPAQREAHSTGPCPRPTALWHTAPHGTTLFFPFFLRAPWTRVCEEIGVPILPDSLRAGVLGAQLHGNPWRVWENLNCQALRQGSRGCQSGTGQENCLSKKVPGKRGDPTSRHQEVCSFGAAP